MINRLACVVMVVMRGDKIISKLEQVSLAIKKYILDT